MKLIFYFTESW